MFEGNLFESLGIEIPKELKSEGEIKKQKKAKQKKGKAVSKAISTKPKIETYVKLPVTVVYGFDNIVLDINEFEKDAIVYNVAKPENSATPDSNTQNSNDNSDSDNGDEYLHDPNIPKVTLEVLRARLEEDYPAFTKERTTMEYDKKKNVVVPVITKGSLGCSNNF